MRVKYFQGDENSLNKILQDLESHGKKIRDIRFVKDTDMYAGCFDALIMID